MSDAIFQPQDVLLPTQGTDLAKWAVIACDQFTSEPEYWDKVEELVGAAPSTLRIILPEVYLEQPGVEQKIEAIHQTMAGYKTDVLAAPFKGYVYVERTLLNGKQRQGLVGCVDLEAYSYEKDAAPMIRPTENTVIERIPPRLAIRRGAALESPHILMLVDDEAGLFIEQAGKLAKKRQPDYQVDLMLDGKLLWGWKLQAPEELAQMQAWFEALAQKSLEKSAHGGKNQKPFVLAVGDGNHSLASAKALWEEVKQGLDEAGRQNHPARYCMVELENIQSEAIEVEPIHRVVFGTQAEGLVKALEDFAKERGVTLEKGAKGEQVFSLAWGGETQSYSVVSSPYPLCVGFVQDFLSGFEQAEAGVRVDYVHGEEAVRSLTGQDAVGVLLPPLQKDELFKGVALGGVLPKKTFSMGHATEKRYYMECRGID